MICWDGFSRNFASANRRQPDKYTLRYYHAAPLRISDVERKQHRGALLPLLLLPQRLFDDFRHLLTQLGNASLALRHGCRDIGVGTKFSRPTIAHEAVPEPGENVEVIVECLEKCSLSDRC